MKNSKKLTHILLNYYTIIILLLHVCTKLHSDLTKTEFPSVTFYDFQALTEIFAFALHNNFLFLRFCFLILFLMCFIGKAIAGKLQRIEVVVEKLLQVLRAYLLRDAPARVLAWGSIFAENSRPPPPFWSGFGAAHYLSASLFISYLC